MSLSYYKLALILDADAGGQNSAPSQALEIRNLDNSLAVIYSDEDGLNPITQPGAVTDSQGNFEFYAVAGKYKAVSGSYELIISVGLDDDDRTYSTLAEVVADKSLSPVGGMNKGRIQGVGDFEIVATNPDGILAESKNGFVSINFGARRDLDVESLRSKVISGDLTWCVLGDSTEAGIGGGGSTYAETNDEKTGGYAEQVFWSLVESSPTFSPVSGKYHPLTSPFDGILPLSMKSWQATASENPEIFASYDFAGRYIKDKVTIYYIERTSDNALQFDVEVRQRNGTVVGSETIDTYTPQADFGAAGSFDVGTRIASTTIDLTAFDRSLDIVMNNFVTVDRGSGAAADGTACILGFDYGLGFRFKNLAVSSTTLTEGSAANSTRGVDTYERLSKAFSFGANCYLIGWGTNDSKIGVTNRSQFKSDYSDLIDSIRSNDEDSVIIVATDPVGLASPYENNRAYNQAAREVAYEKGCILFDVEEISSKFPSDFYSDDVHPSSKGYWMLSESLASVFGIDLSNQNQEFYVEPRFYEEELPEGDSDFTSTWVEIASVSTRRLGSHVEVRSNINLARNTTPLETKGRLKINGVVIDEKLVSIPVVNGTALGQIVLESIYEPSGSGGFDISIELMDYQIRSSNARSTLSYKWFE